MLTVVNEQDNVIRPAPISEVVQKKLLHRAAFTFVLNNNGELFIHKRQFGNRLYPGHYDVCISGGVPFGETYEQTALRELEEEIGAKKTSIELLFSGISRRKNHQVAYKVFRCNYNGPIKLQKEEIIHGSFIPIDKVKTLIQQEKFSPDAIYFFERYLKLQQEYKESNP
ncbi:MAG: NUDIX domain-containing protein [Nanoarchaeota archaeon]